MIITVHPRRRPESSYWWVYVTRSVLRFTARWFPWWFPWWFPLVIPLHGETPPLNITAVYKSLGMGLPSSQVNSLVSPLNGETPPLNITAVSLHGDSPGDPSHPIYYCCPINHVSAWLFIYLNCPGLPQDDEAYFVITVYSLYCIIHTPLPTIKRSWRNFEKKCVPIQGGGEGWTSTVQRGSWLGAVYWVQNYIPSRNTKTEWRKATWVYMPTFSLLG